MFGENVPGQRAREIELETLIDAAQTAVRAAEWNDGTRKRVVQVLARGGLSWDTAKAVGRLLDLADYVAKKG